MVTCLNLQDPSQLAKDPVTTPEQQIIPALSGHKTMSYCACWFCGSGSVGQGTERAGFPCSIMSEASDGGYKSSKFWETLKTKGWSDLEACSVTCLMVLLATGWGQWKLLAGTPAHGLGSLGFLKWVTGLHRWASRRSVRARPKPHHLGPANCTSHPVSLLLHSVTQGNYQVPSGCKQREQRNVTITLKK